MSKSRLNWRISFTEAIEQLDDNECINVIRLLQEELGYDDLNSFVLAITFKLFPNVSPKSQLAIDDKIQQIVNDHHC